MLSKAIRSNPQRFKIKYPNVVTVLLLLVTTGLQLLIWPFIQQGPFILFYPAMVLCALYGNAPLGILLSCILVKAFFYNPQFSILFHAQDAFFFGIFILASVLIWQLGKATRSSLDSLAEAIQARDDFMSIASHELRTPLTSLKLQNQLRARNVEKGNRDAFADDKLKRMFNVDSIQIDRLIRLVDDMLDISRIRTGKIGIDREEVEFSSLVREIVERHHLQLASAGCTVELRCTETLKGHWDRFRLEQVIANLLTNAAKYGQGKPVLISTHRENGRAILKVKDHGMGISKENLERIFERFERAIHPSEVSGLGLGLYIAREILTLHEGTISVESEPGQGSTFTVSLPLS